MSQHFADRLLDAIDYSHAPICVGIDPMLDQFPDELRDKYELRGDEAGGAIPAIYEFSSRVLKVLAPHVPVVKFQIAFFERYLWEGVEAYYNLVHEARELGLLVIGDVKRGDIDTTASAYAAGHLAEQKFEVGSEFATPDAITVNPMLGLDSLAPFVQTARDHKKGLFVLVRTSNPGSADFQDAKMASGITWSEMVAEKLNTLAADPAMIGTRGFSSIGAVVGATQPHTIESLRNRLPHSICLLPGHGAQGATAQMTRTAFKDGRGGLVSASRSILYAHWEAKYASQFGGNWEKCVEAAALDMKKDLGQVLGMA